MKRKILFLASMVLLFWVAPVMAAYKVEPLPDGTYEVTFTYQTNAEDVFLIGEFNNWVENDEALRMTKNAEGIHEITITLAKGTYEYKFFADGQYYTDPTNPDVVGAFANSLATVTSGGMQGELAFSGKLINEFSKTGQDGPVKMNNELSIKFDGSILQSTGEEDGESRERFYYNAELVGKNNLDDIENVGSKLDYITLDEVRINQMNLALLTDYVDYSVQVNLNDNTDSYDYLGLVDANTGNDNRDNTQNINSAGDVRRIKLTPGSELPEDYKFSVNISEYTSDITDSASVKKYYSLLNFSKDLKDPVTGLYKGKVGFTGMAYQPVVAGEAKELAMAGAVFGEYEVVKNLMVRGEYAYIPRGSISESLSGTYEIEPGKWKFIFDPRDYDLEAGDIEEVHLAGTFNGWDAGNMDFPLVKNEAEGIWEGTFELAQGEMFKWIVDGQWTPDGMGNDLVVREKEPDAPLTDGMLYMAEANYRIFDIMRSFRNKTNSYSLDITAGYEVLENGAYLPLAVDSLASFKDTGYNKAYLKGYYYPLRNKDLKLTLDAYYRTAFDNKETEVNESEELSLYHLVPGFDMPEPFAGIEYIKGHIKLGRTEGQIEDAEGGVYNFDWTSNRHQGFEDIRTVFGEIKTKPVGPINYFLFSVNNEKNLRVNDDNRFESVSEIFAEAELDVPVEQIAYVKGNIDFKLNDETGGEQRKPRYWFETKFHHVPEVERYIPYLLVNFESDPDGIIDEGIYRDSNNDWQQKVYAETKLVIPEVDNLEIQFSLESQRLEEGVYPSAADLDEELNAKYVAGGKYIDWYTVATISTGYEFDYNIRADLSVKFDLNHGEISRYEDDAIKLEVIKPLGQYTTINATYNSSHPDHGSAQFISLGLETLF